MRAWGNGAGCQLALTYAPSGADSGTLALSYTYDNNAGVAKTGSVSIPYRATTDNNVAAAPSQNPLAVLIGSSTNVNIVFATDDPNPATGSVHHLRPGRHCRRDGAAHRAASAAPP